MPTGFYAMSQIQIAILQLMTGLVEKKSHKGGGAAMKDKTFDDNLQPFLTRSEAKKTTHTQPTNLQARLVLQSLNLQRTAHALQWITVRGGTNAETGQGSGRHIQLDTTTGVITKGFGAGKTMKEAFNPEPKTERQKIGRKFAEAGAKKFGGSERDYRNLGVVKGQADSFAREYLKSGNVPEGHLKEALVDKPADDAVGGQNSKPDLSDKIAGIHAMKEEILEGSGNIDTAQQKGGDMNLPDYLVSTKNSEHGYFDQLSKQQKEYLLVGEPEGIDKDNPKSNGYSFNAWAYSPEANQVRDKAVELIGGSRAGKPTIRNYLNAEELAKNIELPELKGSEKQVDWANDIRKDGIKGLLFVKESINHLDPVKMGIPTDKQAMIDDLKNQALTAIDKALNNPYASFWIDNKKNVFDPLGIGSLIAPVYDKNMNVIEGNKKIRQFIENAVKEKYQQDVV